MQHQTLGENKWNQAVKLKVEWRGASRFSSPWRQACYDFSLSLFVCFLIACMCVTEKHTVGTYVNPPHVQTEARASFHSSVWLCVCVGGGWVVCVCVRLLL